MKWAMATVLLLLAAGPAGAHSVALPEEILCTQDTALIATVLDARSHDCGPIREGCFSHLIGVTLRVEEVLSPTRSNLRVGDTLSAGFIAFDATKLGDKSGSLGFPVTEQRITDAAAKAEFVGKRLVVAITPISSFKGQPGFAAQVGEPNFAEAYLPADEGWVRATWPTPYCSDFRRR